MIAELKNMFSSGIDIPLEIYCPVNPEHFGLTIQLMIGLKDAEGADSFDTLICTPSWIAEECEQQNGVWGYGRLVVTTQHQNGLS